MLTLMFATCWLPLNVLNVWTGADPDVKNHQHILRIWWACHLTAMSHGCINPIAYLAKNAKFGDALAFSIRCALGRGSERLHASLRYDPSRLVLEL